MQRHVVKSLEDLNEILSAREQQPAYVTLPNGDSGVWLSEGVWQAVQALSDSALVSSKSDSLEKAVSLLIQESKKAEISKQEVARKEEQFVKIFSMSLTPMRIEDWTAVKVFLGSLGKRYNPVEIKEYLNESPETIRKVLESVKVLDCNNAFRDTIDAIHNPEYLAALDEIIPVECYPSIVELLVGLSLGQSELRQDLKIRRFDGGLRDVQVHLSLYSDEQEHETKMLVSYWDITQQKRITRHLGADDAVSQEDKSRSLIALNSIREGAITTDQNGHVINLNPTAKRLTGWQDDFFQRNIEEVFYPFGEDTPEVAEMLVECKSSVSTVDIDAVSILRDRFGTDHWITYSITPIVSDEVISGFIFIFHDVSESKQLLEQIRQHKNQDPITKLLNRQAFRIKLASAVQHAKTAESIHALLLIDLDQFHLVNDSCGHTEGDRLLGEIAKQIQNLVRADDAVARIGGDEFGILLSHCNTGVASRVADKLLETIVSYRFCVDDKLFKLGASIGVVVIDSAIESVDKLLIDASSVVQVAKDNGSNRVQVYDDQQEVLLKKQDELRWFTRINHALENDLLVLSYQRICPTQASDEHPGENHYEILLRMLDEDGSLISPAEFMPAAERYHLMPQIDRWVVKHAFQWVELNLHRSKSVSLFSINLSGHSIGEDCFLDFVEACFNTHHVSGDRICFEITESMAINNMENTLRFIERFKTKGCKFSLDDFGTGFSSYGYLKTLPVDFLKIDGSFVRKITEDPIDLAMVKSINEVGHVMNRKTIAEYVENEETMELLRQIGVDYAQGFGIETPQLLSSLKDIDKKTGT
ncbi:MAG: EAL domain-containing protein [Pseudomonadales bacterium]|nr:EAL domain-containing protein [Pseudomonadales bacterium]